ncbi:MAG: GGDEF domain-containing protein [Deltaproteobacteria bacterium]|nr:GGDEF domain-containing protein [Deltaproteobacteria bacterium]
MTREEKTRVSQVARVPGAAKEGQGCLVVIYGKELGKRYPLDKLQVTIGRGPDNDIICDMDNVSRSHAKIFTSQSGVFVEDQGSTNGTFVNDLEIKREKLRSGDLIKVGGAIFKFLIGGDVEAQYHEEIYSLTIKDGLTQIYNKRYFLEFLEREMARCSRYQRPLTLIMFDLDHFKRVNDEFGHLAGDFVLKKLAGEVMKKVRKEECFARYGGEEFAIVLPDTTLERGATFADKIRHTVETTEFKFEDNLMPVTTSMGVSQMGDVHKEPFSFIKAADEKLYAAKQGGRNRVVT